MTRSNLPLMQPVKLAQQPREAGATPAPCTWPERDQILSEIGQRVSIASPQGGCLLGIGCRFAPVPFGFAHQARKDMRSNLPTGQDAIEYAC